MQNVYTDSSGNCTTTAQKKIGGSQFKSFQQLQDWALQKKYLRSLAAALYTAMTG